jgi:RNA polymerase sigma-70 factor (ECF subfamily)
MTTKSRSSLERLWDIEDKFSPLVGTAIGTVYPALSKQAISRKEQTSQKNSKKAADDFKSVVIGPDIVTRSRPPKVKSHVSLPQVEDNLQPEKTAYRDAVYQLSVTHWRSILSFIYRRGYSAPDAQDLTQDFFLTVLEGDLLKQADLASGQFRAFLLELLQHFLITAESRNKARQHGEIQFISWDELLADPSSAMFAPRLEAKYWTAERTFDVRWAATVAERGLRRLAEECATKGRRRVYDILSKYLAADSSDIQYGEVAKALGTDEPSTKRLLHHMRQRYRSLLREEVAKTVEKDSQIDEEIRYLCRALADADRETDEAVWNKWLTAQRKTLVAIRAELWGKSRISRVRRSSQTR